MTFQPIVLGSSYAGWKFLERTKEDQQEVFNASVQMKRDTKYFRENIASVKSAEDLVADRRLLSVALSAFGLSEDIGNTFFIKKVLTDGSSSDEALANRLSDKRYLALSKVFGFGDLPVSNTQLSDFPDRIISAFQTQQFEVAVGNQNENMRLALGVERELGALQAKEQSDDSSWFMVMGTPTLRQVFSEALGVPTSIGSLDLDRQLIEFRERAERIFGDGEVAQFSDPEKQEKLLRRFLVRAETSAGLSATSSGAIALALLQNFRS